MDEKRGMGRMKFYYNDQAKGVIEESGEVTFFDEELEDAKEDLFSAVVQEEQEDGNVVFVEQEMTPELKISTLKMLGFTFKDEEVDKGLDSRKNFSKLAVVLKEEIDKFIRLYKKKPTREDIEKRLEKMRLNMKMELNYATKEFIQEQYTNVMRNMASQLNTNIFLDSRDQEAIAVLSGQKVLSDSFDKITNKASQKIREAIIKSYNNPNGINLEDLNETIRKVGNISDFHAETIARTETSKVSSAARRNTYKKVDPSNTYKYRHIGPSDYRTSNTCKELVARTKDGVLWDEYVAIMKEVSAKSFPEWTVDESTPVAHYNCRHSFVASR